MTILNQEGSFKLSLTFIHILIGKEPKAEQRDVLIKLWLLWKLDNLQNFAD